MNSRLLSEFHAQSRDIDYRTPLESLLDEFRSGHFADPDRVLEDAAMVDHFGDLWSVWDRLFPDFPETLRKRRSVMWEHERGRMCSN